MEICREDYYGLSFTTGSFDCLLMANLLHVIPFPERALKEAKRVLKRGGKLFLLSFWREIARKLSMDAIRKPSEKLRKIEKP